MPAVCFGVRSAAYKISPEIAEEPKVNLGNGRKYFSNIKYMSLFAINIMVLMPLFSQYTIIATTLSLAVVAYPSFAQTLTLPLPDEGFQSPHFLGSGNCGVCHNGLKDAQGIDVSIERDWKITMMANAARDPLWQAKVASELKRNPQLADAINETCTRCHAPMANVEAGAAGADVKLFYAGSIDTLHPDYDAAMDGVSCTLCHQIEDDGQLGTEAGASGGYSINLDQKVAYGPKVKPRINPMRNETGFTPMHGPHMSDSDVCGTCHDLKTPFVDGDGIIVPQASHAGFPEQMVYTEWLNSAYAPGKALDKSCQDCHMPETDGVKLANRPPWLEAEDNFSRHTFLGTNTVMLSILDNNSDQLGVTAADFSPAIESSRANLANAAQVRIMRNDIANGRLRTWIGVRNLTGHKLPSGYPSRRVYLHFVVKDKSGKVVFESGRMRPDGSIMGVDGDDNPGTYEPHQTTISQPNQVQVYESVMGNTDGDVTHTLLEAAGYLKDNRLLPAGAVKAKLPTEIAVHGLAESDPNFAYASDAIRYLVALPDGQPGDVYTVEVALKYQPLSYAYLQDLFEDQDEPAVERFKLMYEAIPLRAETIASASSSVAR